MNKLKHITFFALLAFSFVSCQSLKFNRYPGEALQEFPDQFIGEYINYKINRSDSDTVSAIITKKSYSVISKTEKAVDVLDSKHVFSTYKDRYFLFVQEKEYWSGFEMKRSGEYLIVTPCIVPQKSDSIQNKKVLDKYFSNVRFVPADNNLLKGNYVMDMNEMNLLKYIKKSKKYSIKFIKVKP